MKRLLSVTSCGRFPLSKGSPGRVALAPRQPELLAEHGVPDVHGQLPRRAAEHVEAPHHAPHGEEPVVGLRREAEVVPAAAVERSGPKGVGRCGRDVDFGGFRARFDDFFVDVQRFSPCL